MKTIYLTNHQKLSDAGRQPGVRKRNNIGPRRIGDIAAEIIERIRPEHGSSDPKKQEARPRLPSRRGKWMGKRPKPLPRL